MSTVPHLTRAVEHALRAPSVHNTQPWLWRIRPQAVELHADLNRHLVATDPDRRDLVLSCGAALHHLLVALAAGGWSTDVSRLPDPEDSRHLATVAVGPGPPDAADAALFPSIPRRHTDRRRMSHRTVPADAVRLLVDQARRTGGLLLPVHGTGMRKRLADALVEAARRQTRTPGYAAELQVWTRRYTDAHDGIPASTVAVTPAGLCDPSTLRLFPRAALKQPPAGPGMPDDAAELLVMVTAGDGVADRLRAGEATSAVLLAATGMGLATTPLSQGMEIEESRHAIRMDVLHVPEYPQLVLRVGLPAAHAADLPGTPRRDLRAVLLPS